MLFTNTKILKNTNLGIIKILKAKNYRYAIIFGFQYFDSQEFECQTCVLCLSKQSVIGSIQLYELNEFLINASFPRGVDSTQNAKKQTFFIRILLLRPRLNILIFPSSLRGKILLRMLLDNSL